MSIAESPLASVALAGSGGSVAAPSPYETGESTVTESTDFAAVWAAIVTIDSIDVSDDVIGEIRIDAEEGSARVADFTLGLATGETLFLPDWTGKAVTISIADIATGSPVNSIRLFTGLIDRPALNLEARTLGLSCTDDLQGVVSQKTQAELTTLIAGYWSPVVFDAAASSWAYAQDRLSTRPASLDLSPSGVLRVTPWAAKSVADIDFDADRIGAGSLSVELADRASLVNQINLDFGYRFPRVKNEAYAVTYSYVNAGSFAAYILAGNWFLQRDAVLNAISSAGGTVQSIVWDALPTAPVAVGAGYWTPSAVDIELCMGFAASISFDFGQETEETHAITINCPASITSIGTVAENMQGALVGVYPETEAVETSILLFKNNISSIPPLDSAPPLTGKTNTAEVTLTTETNRAAANAAMEALIAVAKARIWASHRKNTVSATAPLNPAIDLDKTLSVIADGVTAKGKCRRVSHRMDTDSGAAISEFTLAICSVSGVGISHPEDATAAPTGTTAGNTTLAGSSVIVFNSGPSADHQFSISFPAVEAAERDKAATTISSAYRAPLLEDVFTITV